MNCNGCTLCCKMLNIPWMRSPSGIYCRECTPGLGCRIYDSAPEKCLSYNCMYSSHNERVGLKFRPDNLGVIFELVDEKLIHGLVGKEDVKKKKKRKYFFGKTKREGWILSKDASNQIGSFCSQGYFVILSIQGEIKPTIYFPKGKANNMTGDYIMQKFLDLKKYGSADLLN